ncbi:hypothetical protein BUALT_Bualt18G0048000 [Buddleja alternifolia]|uniref:CCHC-type domain-containing protein n=1 Tax=Buddleja alternifolia TaxID=168488 RepID=A0AAV6W4L4_9LAMI|nr:hypothetical protein BUALT_Bualt18G0048000 [Buddleja alternifolia]
MASCEDANSVKPEKFNGLNFKRWQNQMKYWLTVLGFMSAIDENIESSSWQTPENVDYHCRNRILSALSERLYDVYHTFTSAKELWDALEADYGIDDAGIVRFNASTFTRYIMVDEKSINEQIHEFQDLLKPLEEGGSKFSEDYKVSCLIDKLPPSWSNFARGLRHQQGSLTLSQVFKSLRVEEQHRINVKQEGLKAKANLVEDKRNYNQNRFKPRGNRFKINNKNWKKDYRHNNNNNNNNRFKTQNYKDNKGKEKIEKPCFVCGRTNHMAKDCYYKKTEKFNPRFNPKPNNQEVNMLVNGEPSIMRVRGGNGCKVGDDNGSLMLMWEDGFCRGRHCLDEMNGEEDLVRKAFSKMSIQLYNYGEGLMGKVASDKCHKWVFKEPTECETNISNYWQSSFDAIPTEWTEQFESGIQTIAVIQAGHGLLQLGSCKIIPEDLHFVLRMRHTFESLGYQSGFYLSQLFSSTRNASSSSTVPLKQPAMPIRPPPPVYNWGPHPIPSMMASPNFQNNARLGIPPSKDETQMFMLPHSSESTARMEDMMGDHENDLKWPNGLTFFNALTGRADEVKLLDPNSDCGAGPNEFLSLDSQSKMEGKFKRAFTLPTKMTTSSSSTSLDHHTHNHGEYRNEAGMYSDVMESFLE